MFLPCCKITWFRETELIKLGSVQMRIKREAKMIIAAQKFNEIHVELQSFPLTDAFRCTSISYIDKIQAKWELLELLKP